MVAVVSAIGPVGASIAGTAGFAGPTAAVGGALIPGLGIGLLPTALAARGGPLAPARDRFPGIKPGDLLKAALQIQSLSERGLVPVASTDPFTGNLVVSTADQAPVVETLLGERFAREALAPTEEEIAAVGTFRQGVIDALRKPTARVVAPGVVIRRTSELAQPRRLGGPCAAANTGFSRLTCARGGFS